MNPEMYDHGPDEGPDGDAGGSGNFSPLDIPEEDIGADHGGTDIDLSQTMDPLIRKPEEFERFAIYPKLTMTTRLLIRKVGPGGMDTEYYYVIPPLRKAVAQYMRDTLVAPWWSIRDSRWNLWVVKHRPGSTWFDSLQVLLQQPDTFFDRKEFTVFSTKENNKYVFSWYDATAKVPTGLPRPVGQMLGLAIGPKGRIESTGHKIYTELIAGSVVR